MKKIINLIFIIMLSLIVVACQSNNSNFNCDENKYKKNPIATIKIKGYGVMKYELFINKAPQTVANFSTLANDGFYDNLSIHRIAADLAIIQGGDPNGDGSGGPGYTIKGEFEANQHCNNLQNEAGTIAMARSQEYDSAGSQFFLNYKDNTNIFNGDNQYAVFGKIIEGDEILLKIGNSKTNNTVPVKPIIIESIRVELFDQKLPEFEKIK